MTAPFLEQTRSNLASSRGLRQKKTAPSRGRWFFRVVSNGRWLPRGAGLFADLEVAEARGVLAAFQAALEALGLGAFGADGLTLLLFLGPHRALEREADLALVAVDAEDLDVDLLPDLDDVLGLLDLLVGDLADVQQAFEAGLELDEHSEVGDLCHEALDGHVG